MNVKQEVTKNFIQETEVIDASLKEFLLSCPDLEMYAHLEYFMGFRDESLASVECYGGKRFRAGLCLMLADWYGVKELCVPIATSIELFHNFTLIHDDIVDEDTLRRGRPTVWKLFGTHHAINDGDAQLILALQVVIDSKLLSNGQKIDTLSFLTKQYLKVTEGQHLDFSLTDASLDDSSVTTEMYLDMLGKKTSDLVAAATKVVGILACKNEDECSALFDYGYNLGMAYQLCDDVVSIWGSQEQTGKQLWGDIYEKKKTMPITHLYENGSKEIKEMLRKLYAHDSEITTADAQYIVGMLEEENVFVYVYTEVQKYAQRAKDVVSELSVTQTQKQVLKNIVDQLLLGITKL